MKTIPAFCLRSVPVIAILVLSSLARSAELPFTDDPASMQLATNGAVAVKSAGAYVELGTLRIQVSTKLGRPSTILPDGTWLYSERAIDQSHARGTLVVRFNRGRVSELALVTPAVATAMRSDPHKPLSSYLVATK